jgi:hypothetical protein
MVVSIPGGVDNDIRGPFEIVSASVASIPQVTLILLVDFETRPDLAGYRHWWRRWLGEGPLSDVCEGLVLRLSRVVSLSGGG